MSPEIIAEKILYFRKRKGLSQEALAKHLNIPRSSVAQIELGNRGLSAMEFISLSEILEFSMDEFIVSEYKQPDELDTAPETRPKLAYTQGASPKLDLDNLKMVLLYILERCAGKPNLGESVINKLLYFADFNYFEIYEEHLTGATYRKLPYGPALEDYETIMKRMVDNDLLKRIRTEYQGYPQIRYFPLAKPDLKRFSAAAKEVIDQVINRFSDWSASAIREYSQLDVPWRATANGEIIDYELCFFRDQAFSCRTYAEHSRHED